MDVLQFSGGKDSLACLYLLREKWDDLVVMWTNAGAPWPQTIEQMEEIRNLVPNFLEITGDVLAQNEVKGIPADVVPIVNTLLGQTQHGRDPITIQSWFSCCGDNLWMPMLRKTLELKPKIIYRGQRNAEKYKSLVKSGQVYYGIEFIFPLEDWSEHDVDKFLVENNIEVPEYYSHSDKSLDCWHCTAYLEERGKQIQYLKETEPRKYAIVSENLKKIRVATEKQLQYVNAAL